MYGERGSMRVTMVDEDIKVRILLVDDDSTCLAVVAAMLRLFDYQVATANDPLEALSTLRMNHKHFDIILSDVHMPNMNGIDLQKHVQKEFQLPVILMSGDDQRSKQLEALESGALLYIVKPPTVDDLKNIWQYVVSRRKAMNDERLGLDYAKRRLLIEDVGDKFEDKYVCTNPKKPKLIWTTSLHNKFLEAITAIGFDRAVPKKILEYMNVPGLKRENIASHLQKYRIYLRRLAEARESIEGGTPDNWNEKPFRSGFSWSQFPALASNSFLLNCSRNLMQQQAMALVHNNLALGRNSTMSLMNTSFAGSEVINQQMNNSSSTVGNPIFESSYLAGEINILESSMISTGQDFCNNQSDLASQGDLGTAAMQFLTPKAASNFNQFEVNSSQVESLLVANGNGTTMTQMGVANNSAGFYGIPNDMINGSTLGVTKEENQGFNSFNGSLQQGNQQGAFNNDHSHAESQYVVQDVNTNLDNNIPTQLVVPQNNAQEITPVPGQKELDQDMLNFDFSSGSPCHFQDWATKNLDDFSMDGIDDLAVFLSSFDANYGSNNQLP